MKWVKYLQYGRCTLPSASLGNTALIPKSSGSYVSTHVLLIIMGLSDDLSAVKQEAPVLKK